MHFVPINFSDPGFNTAYTDDLQLLIVLNQHNFSYAVRDPAKNKLVRLNSGNQVKDLFEPPSHLLLLTSTYQKVVVAVETNSFCLIPNAVFTPENLLDYAAFLSIKEADVILTDQIENDENTVIFTFPGELIHKIKTQFKTKAIQFAPKSWIKTVIKAQIPGKNLYLFLAENQLRVFFPDQENIRFYNQFECSTTNEILYYTALVADQLKLKPEETDLIICGRIEKGGEQMLRLKEFFKHVLVLDTQDFNQQNYLQECQVVDFLNLD